MSPRKSPREQESWIAIVGMACRFPDAPSPADFWRALLEEHDAVCRVPPSRWDVESKFHPDPQAPGTINSRWGAFLPEVDQFDPLFFGISPREAAAMDPQQRLMLELSWEALEDAGVAPDSLRGSTTGVFFGACWSDYGGLVHRGSLEQISGHTATGFHYGIIANRVSYQLGLEGPSMVVDTACSSSLVAAHLACQSLLSRESELCLAGGVNLNFLYEHFLAMSKLGVFSPDGRCKAFDTRADGYARGEGAGVLVLCPLEAALARGLPIYCVIRGSAVNNDGRSSGLTAPSARAHMAMLRRAYAVAGLSPASVDYVEAHGTGTQVGDPIEVQALGEVLCEGRPADAPLLIGSVKTNIGHLEAAAGAAGLIKTALGLRNGMLPGTLHFDRPNPALSLDALPMRVQDTTTPWPERGHPRRAGVSGFGFGGTNGHLVLEEFPAPRGALLRLAEAEAGALRARVDSLRQCLRPGSADTLAGLCLKADATRGEGRFRLAAAARSLDELRQQLDAFAAGRQAPGLVAGEVLAQRGRLAFLCAGVGSQWPGMGRQLLMALPSFRTSIVRTDACLHEALGWSVVEQLAANPGSSRLEDPAVAIPLVFAIQVALGESLRGLGIEPDFILGHGTGEVAAACLAGALTLQDAAHLSALLGRLAGQPSARELEARLPQARLTPRTPLLSTLHAGLVRPELLGPEHWRVLLERPVALEQGLRQLAEQGADALLELSPHPVLGGSPQEPLPLRTVLPTLLRGEDEAWSLLAALGALHVRGEALRPSPLMLGDTGRHAPVRRISRQLSAASAPEPAQLVVLTAHGDGALREASRELSNHVERHSHVAVGDLAYTLSARRTHREHRLAFLARDRSEVLMALSRFASGREHPELFHGRASRGAPRRIVHVFPGQGSQWLGMGRELLRTDRLFRERVESCDALVRGVAGFSVIDVLESSPQQALFERIDILQPVLWSLQVALSELWTRLGAVPSAVIGHSFGEVAAACVSGGLSLEQGAQVICARSRLMHQLSVGGGGAMMAVELSEQELRSWLAPMEGHVSIAALNGPTSSVLSGEAGAVHTLEEALQRAGVRVRRLLVNNVASHSPLVEPLLEPLRAALVGLQPGTFQIPFHSTAREGELNPVLDADYWADNLRGVVRFAPVAGRLLEAGHDTFIEVSPHLSLGGPLQQMAQQRQVQAQVIASLDRNLLDRESLLRSVAALFVQGVPLDLEALFPEGGQVVETPLVTWQRQRCWLEEAPEPEVREAPLETPPRPVEALSASTPRPRPVSEPRPILPAQTRPATSPRATLVREIAAIFKMQAEQLPVDRPLWELGLDSMLALKLSNRMRALFGVELSSSDLLRDGSVEWLTTQVVTGGSSQSPQATARQPEPPPPPARVTPVSRPPAMAGPSPAPVSMPARDEVDQELLSSLSDTQVRELLRQLEGGVQ